MSSDEESDCVYVRAGSSSRSMSSLSQPSPFSARAPSAAVPQWVKKEPKGSRQLSWVWEHFLCYNPALGTDKKALCLLCKNEFVVNMGKDLSTSVLIRHVEAHHRAVFHAHVTSDAMYPKGGDDNSNYNGNESSVQIGVKRKSFHQLNIQNFAVAPEIFDAEICNSKLTKLIVRSFMPINFCENEDFRDYSSYLYRQVPRISSRSMNESIMWYAERGRNIVKFLMNEQYFSMTTDHWTSTSRNNFVSVTAHFIDSNWELKSFVLCCSEHQGTQGAEEIVQVLNKTKEQFQLNDDLLVATVTDTAANMNAAGQLMSKAHHYCADHVLELTAKLLCNLKGVNEILATCRSIVGSIRHSSLAEEELKRLQIIFNELHPKEADIVVTVIQDINVRWWSTFNMLERFLRLQRCVNLMCISRIIDHTVLLSHEWLFIEHLNKLLRPFKNFQLILEGEKYVTISMLPEIIINIRKHLISYASDATTTANIVDTKITKKKIADGANLVDVANLDEANIKDSIANIAKILLEDFCNRWGDGEEAFDQSNYRVDRNRQIGIPKLAFIAAAMDPRTKELDFLSEGDKAKVWNCVDYLMKFWSSQESQELIVETPVAGSPHADVVNNDPSETPNDLFDAHDSRVDLKMRPSSSMLSELDIYKNEIPLRYKDKITKKRNNPLDWWKLNACRFPNVAKLARAVLSIPATSAPSERVFSTAGRTITAERARMLPEHADDLVFLHDNYRAIPNIFNKTIE